MNGRKLRYAILAVAIAALLVVTLSLFAFHSSTTSAAPATVAVSGPKFLLQGQSFSVGVTTPSQPSTLESWSASLTYPNGTSAYLSSYSTQRQSFVWQFPTTQNAPVGNYTVTIRGQYQNHNNYIGSANFAVIANNPIPLTPA